MKSPSGSGPESEGGQNRHLVPRPRLTGALSHEHVHSDSLMSCISPMDGISMHSPSSRANSEPTHLMDAASEANMANRAPRDVVFVRPHPSARIAVGGAEKHQHLFAFAE